MKQIKLFLIPILLLLLNHFCSAQDVYVNLQNTSIYDFIDELANNKIIDLNSVVKPYSRIFIAEKLNEASAKTSQLSKRQLNDLNFYLLDYGKELPGFKATDFLGKNLILKNKVPFKKCIDLFYYKDSLFTFTFNPIMGLTYYKNENGTNYHRWNGAEAYATIGKNWGFYASLRDNHESELLAKSKYLTQQTGGSFKPDSKGGGDYEEMKGGITYSWKWGSVGIVKDNITWGNNYNGANIISDRAPSFPFLKLHLNPAKWFDFNYFHGWLSSLVVDSNQTYNYGNGTRIVYRAKYIAANMFTVTPFKRLNVSLGNSIIYSDQGVNPVYLIPVLFYKAVDHSQNGMNNNAGQNAQMFFDVSSRQIKHLHLYSTLFVDEVNTHYMWNDTMQSNLISFKCGFALSGFPLKNLTLIGEFTRTNPLTYKHFIPTTIFESDQYSMGNYLRDNSKEYFISLKYRPYKFLLINASFTYAEKGPDYIYAGGHNQGLPFIDCVIWEKKCFALNIKYEIFNDIFITGGCAISDIKDNFKIYTPAYFTGNTNTFNFGVNWGF